MGPPGMGLVPLQESHKNFLPVCPLPGEDTVRGQSAAWNTAVGPEPDHAGPLTLDARTVRDTFLLFMSHPVQVIAA